MIDLFSLSSDQLIVVAAFIAADIAQSLTSEEQEIVAWLFEAIGQNLSVFGAVEALRQKNNKNDDSGIVK
ncbi:hypothetical protein [Clostridium septicum]|uniref:Uncharacterized protein n=1 Tax=Clostridium septicum TaxID=1504 RepID=A0A9N7JKP6_CLOSE|nr:hypothetical protein [Clostridium septicum]AYE34178.1 hypothetical protein CP523_06685 [Clostridium septicum]MDU1315343.1 hypothetical protein [Clostridium septicum]QAS59541.1 hypothetical protein EI377_01150 [Clostridium septicum]UEC21193.1 hypothetical protein LK444_02095 [Clostridium septicum]USS00759.1 hypothetical protein NH397_15000 [Clostridium septicum]